MAIDFNVDVHVKTDGKEKVDELERQIEKLNGRAIDLKLNVDGDGADFIRNFNRQLESLNKSALSSGQNVSKSFSKGIKSVNLDGFYEEYFKQEEKNKKKAAQLKNKYADSYAPSESEDLKAVRAKQSAETKATNEYIREQERLHKKKIDNAAKERQYEASIERERQKSRSISDQESKRQIKEYDTRRKKELEYSDWWNKTLAKKESFSGYDAIMASNKTFTWLKNNSAAAKDYGDQLKIIAEAQRKATSFSELKDLNKQFRVITSEASRLGKTGNSFGDEFKRAFMQIGQFSQIYGGIDKFVGSVSNAVSELKQMDDILTEISKVSDMSSSQLKELGNDAFDYANKYGKKVTDYLEGVTEMNRSGYYGQQGIDLANKSVLAQAAGDMSANVANAYLLATNAAYEYAGSAEKLNAVLDGQNMITNRNSVDMNDMAEATTQAGSMAAQAGVEIDQLSALIGTAVARTKKSGNEIGTALKALFINLQNTQNSKIVGTFDNLGISMTKMVDDTELLKTPIELIKELSDAYNTLPDGSVMKADILTNIGGKHHANVLSSILSGYNEYEKMLKDYSEGTGSAAVEANFCLVA